MSILAKDKRNWTRAFVPTSAVAISIEFAGDMINVHLADGRIVCVPLVWFPLLAKATPEQRAAWEIGGGGVSLHWPELDEDLSLVGLMAVGDGRSG